MERKVLGRGLDALIGGDEGAPKERVQMIRIDQVQLSPFQPRMTFSDRKIEELAQSIREKGIIQPVLVRPGENDTFELIAGERRLRAATLAGLGEIPAIVRRVADSDVLEMAIVENVQREDLNAIDEAKAYHRLSLEFGFNIEQISKKVGKDQSTISNILRLLKLPEKVQDFLNRELITVGHAKAILSLIDPESQIQFCHKIIEKGLSVRQAEFLTSRQARRHKSRGRKEDDPNIRALEKRLMDVFGTKVKITHKKKRGKIEIEYYSLDDLERVLRKLCVNEE